MKDENTNTKLKIQQVALKLFAKRGYKAVSIRDICKEVGIKESSIYYHYKNKQAILDAILDQAQGIITQMASNFNQVFTEIKDIEEEAFCKVAVAFLEGYLLNEFIYQLIAMLSIERFSDEKSAELYQKLVFQVPLEGQEKVFREMIRRGLIREEEPSLLAYTYYAMIYLAFEKNCLNPQCEVADREQAILEIQRSMSKFFRRIRRD